MLVSPDILSQKPSNVSKYQLSIKSSRKLKLAEDCILPVGYSKKQWVRKRHAREWEAEERSVTKTYWTYRLPSRVLPAGDSPDPLSENKWDWIKVRPAGSHCKNSMKIVHTLRVAVYFSWAKIPQSWAKIPQFPLIPACKAKMRSQSV